MSSNVVVALGSAMARWIPAGWMNRMIAWMGACSYPIRWTGWEGNNVALNRSVCFGAARQAALRMPRTTVLHIQVDTDVFPVVPLDRVVQIALEDFREPGVRIVASPTVAPVGYDAHQALLQIGPRVPYDGPAEEGGFPKGKAFDVAYVPFGLVAFHPSFLVELPTLGRFKYADGKAYDLFFERRGSYSEDTLCCEMARKLGYRVQAEPRFWALHRHLADYASYGMPESPGGEASREDAVKDHPEGEGGEEGDGDGEDGE